MRFFLVLIFSLSLAFGGLLKDEIAPQMQAKIDSVLEILQNKTLDEVAVSEKIFELLDGNFDFNLMARLSLGSSQWRNLNTKDQERFTEHFIAKLKRSLVQKLRLYSDEIMVIKETREVRIGNATRIFLITELIGQEKNYPIVYKFYETRDGEWMIYDVDVLEVSLIQTYRSQFDGYLNNHTLDDLIAWLDKDEEIE
jgi:phospholipid transport system substrate-binding protein